MEKVRYMISDAAALAGVETHVLRYWEEELDLTIPRNEMGHRYYTRENIQEFQKIKELKEKGYQLKAIRMILHNKNPEDAGVSVPDSAAPGPLPACNREHHHTVVAKPNRQNTMIVSKATNNFTLFNFCRWWTFFSKFNNFRKVFFFINATINVLNTGITCSTCSE